MEHVTTVLEARTLAYTVFQSLTGNEPNQKLLDAFFLDDTCSVFRFFGTTVDEEFSETFKIYDDCKTDFLSDSTGYTAQALKEYTQNFIGPEHLVAPPWESAISSVDHLLMQEATLNVRRCYTREGFVADLYPNVAEDHIAYELDFIKHLSTLTSKAVLSEDNSSYRRLLQSQVEFLDQHLLAWIPQYSIALQGSRTHVLYPQLATILEAFLRLDRRLLNELSLGD